MNKSQRKVTPYTQLVSRDDVNVRLPNRYFLDQMAMQIVILGRIVEPLVVEEQEDKKSFLVLKGNRRFRALTMMINDPNIITSILLAMAENETDLAKSAEIKRTVVQRTKEIVEELKKVTCEVHKFGELLPTEREDIILDHGTVQGLGRTETVLTCWRYFRQGFSEREIIIRMYGLLADYTGERKIKAEVDAMTDPAAKEKRLQKWLHGTVGNQFGKVLSMTDYVRQQYILSRKAEDQALMPDEKVEVKMTSARVTELSSAITKDRNAKEGGKGWNQSEGGENYNALLEQFRKEDSGEVAKPAKEKRLTAAQLVQKAGYYSSPTVRKALSLAAGEPGDWSDLYQADGEAVKEHQNHLIVERAWDKLPEAVKDFAKHWLGDDPTKFTLYVTQITTPPSA